MNVIITQEILSAVGGCSLAIMVCNLGTMTLLDWNSRIRYEDLECKITDINRDLEGIKHDITRNIISNVKHELVMNSINERALIAKHVHNQAPRAMPYWSQRYPDHPVIKVDKVSGPTPL